MGGSEACRGLAFIVEGATEKVFYLEYLSQLCAAKGLALRKDLDTQENRYAITSANDEKVVMMASVKRSGEAEDRIAIAAFGPTPVTPTSNSKQRSSSRLKKPKISNASSRM